MSGKFKYKIVTEVLTDGNVKLCKYKSQNSGMTICIAEVNGPIVEGFLTFAIEAFADDGLPHALQHLVLLGSEKYPYKGFLDMIANRCLSEVANASTDTVHTCHKVSTAGAEGFLKILPIYLDHLLFPILTDAAFTTEVHHINGEGEDAGVVYCEMQGQENIGELHVHRAMIHDVYPDYCGYKSETSGLMKNLRESATNEKVHSYHKKFYRPENLCCIIIGQIDAEKVFEALIPVEERILQKNESNKFVKPWQTPVPPLLESVTKQVQYPADEDKCGMVMVAWQGPLANDFSNVIAMQVLLDYFTDTAVAPINRDFIQIEDSLCNGVDNVIIENSVTCIYLHFLNVPVSRLLELKEKLFALLRDVVDGKEKIDMQRMTALIRNKKLDIFCNLENAPHEHLASCLIWDFLYGSTTEDLEHRVKEIRIIEKLHEKDAQFWVDLLKKYLLDNNHVVILGTPSPELSYKMSEVEKERIKKQQEMLGPDGLKEKAEILKRSIEANSIPPPKELLASIEIPSVKSMKFHTIKRICNVLEFEGDDVEYSVRKMPCRFQVDCIQTNFVRLFVMLDTSILCLEDRMYLPLLIELLDKCAVKRNGEIVPYQDVVKQLAEDTILISASLGLSCWRFFSANYAEIICLSLMVEEEKYTKSVQWVHEILYQIIIEPSRIKFTINEMMTDLPTVKKNGSAILDIMMKNLCFTSDSNHWTSSIFRQHIFLTNLLKKLESDPNEVVSKLNEIRKTITDPGKIVVHLALNLNNLKEKVQPEVAWIENFLPAMMKSSSVICSNFRKCSEYIQPISKDGTKSLIAGIDSEDSSFLMQSSACCVEGILDYSSLLVLCEYFIKQEGLMWQQICGCGFANYYDIEFSYDTGLIYFKLYDSTHLVEAYKEAVNIIDSHLNGTIKWDKQIVESARCCVMFELIEKLETVPAVIRESVRAYCFDTSIDIVEQRKELVENVSKVTTTDLEHVGMMHLKPLFNPELSRCAITCNPKNIKDITEEFKKLSRELTVVPSLDDSFMAKY